MGERDVVLVLTTVGSDQAEAMAATLVDEGLVACVNELAGLRSTYRWEGKLCQDQESLLILKSVGQRLEQLKTRIAALHSYDVPEMLVFRVDDGLPSYLDWVVRSTSSDGATS